MVALCRLLPNPIEVNDHFNAAQCRCSIANCSLQIVRGIANKSKRLMGKHTKTAASDDAEPPLSAAGKRIALTEIA